MASLPKIRTLQSLRALAALLVVFDHAALVSAHHGLTDKLPSLGLFLGVQGVAIFFIISGFIMTYTADATEDSSARRALDFAIRRIVRVVPLYWIFTIVIGLAASLIGMGKLLEITPGHLIKSLFFVPYVNSHTNLLPVLPMGWTLNYEMIFYALFTATVLLPHRFRVLALLGTLGAAVGVGSIFFPILSGSNPRSVGEFLTYPVILLFGLGAVLGSLRLRHLDFTLKFPGLPFALPLLALSSFLAFVAHQVTLPLMWNACFWLIDGVIVALCIFGSPLSMPRLEAVGNASYSLYLVHLLPLFACFIIWKQLHFAAPSVFIIAALATSAGTALASYRWLEKPLTRKLASILERPRTAAIAPVPALEPVPLLQQA
ncbi:acyltransferase family protein [Granulicella arctica]|uniref:acyltransferase family protein n=1 Tax=Granulicella arctica TaxID=940613 RepID=UPI0021E04C4B|nr:acyltransferase [Granulicella arctica]